MASAGGSGARRARICGALCLLAAGATALVAAPPSVRAAAPRFARQRREGWDDEAPVKATRQIPRHRRLAAKKRPQSSKLGLGETGSATRLRVVAGTARGRKLDSPATLLRPMMGKVREALFSTLFSMGVLAGDRRVRHLDGFCGSGSVGCEALSRGAEHCAFVDLSRDACDVAARNAGMCGFPDAAVATVCARIEDALGDESLGGFDLVTLTPPYEEVDYADLLRRVAASPLLNADCVVVVEYPVELGVLPPTLGEFGSLVGLRNRRYGRTVLAFYAHRPTGRLPGLAPRADEFAPFT